jgi:hypothetical protein
VYIFRIKPKEDRAGLIRGEIWIEALTGAPVLVTGHLVKAPSSSIRRINVTSEITLLEPARVCRVIPAKSCVKEQAETFRTRMSASPESILTLFNSFCAPEHIQSLRFVPKGLPFGAPAQLWS